MKSTCSRSPQRRHGAFGEDLRGVLAELDPAVAQPLLDRLSVEAHPTPLLVFTGYHSSGKSTLIEALTNRRFDIPIGSGVTTDEVAEYDWDGDVRLVDTPGVHAGRPQHDERAERALQAADLVLFAVPVELFDDTLVAHLRDVLGRLGKSRQTIIVITKAGTMDAAPGHREAAIQQALGPFDAGSMGRVRRSVLPRWPRRRTSRTGRRCCLHRGVGSGEGRSRDQQLRRRSRARWAA